MEGAVMSENLIEKVLCEHITDRNCFFIFPTQIAADLWADRATLVTSVTAVATERFVAWDHFKSESVRSRHQDKKSVPSAMRRIFASSVIKANAEKPFFSYIITQEYSRSAQGFTDWITKLLPELALWKNLFDTSGGMADDEDKDLMQLYNRYSAFLEKYGFFDPAWETPPFQADGNHYYIFFPEILSDYMEYEAILKSSPDITIISMPKSEKTTGKAAEKTAAGEVLFFNNSRTEIKHVAGILRELHEKRGIQWNDIAVSVPDLESYGAYISREFMLFEIPHVVRSAVSLSAAGAGSLFSQIKQCASSGCNYDSLYALLLNAELPWNDVPKNRSLLDFGRENHCICNYDYNGERINVWEKSFDEALCNAEEASDNPKKGQRIALLRGFYRSLRGAIDAIASSETFEKLRDNYFAFRERFFDMSKCSVRSDLILSRCIKELGNLIDLEKEYLSGDGSVYKPDSVFSFFTDYISGIQYLEQTDKTGVQILPYKLGSCAPFACHVIVDASQNSVSVIYEELAFLQENKRKKLTRREEVNCTDEFLRLYSMNSIECDAYFTAAEKTFTGYAQVSSSLEEKNMRSERNEDVLFKINPYSAEKKWLLSSGENQLPDNALFPKQIPECAKKSFENWLAVQPSPSAECLQNGDQAANAEPLTSVDQADTKNAFSTSGKIYISKTSLDTFFFCPYKWLLRYRFGLKEIDSAATLMNQYAYGNLYHKICELFMKSLQVKNLPLHAEDGMLPPEYDSLLLESVDEGIAEEECYLPRELLFATKTAVIEQMRRSMSGFAKMFDGCAVDEVESEYTIQIPGKTYVCTGRIDCLLRDIKTDKYFLVDYKTVKVPERFFPNEEDQDLPLMQQELPDFQMPMYVVLLKNAEKPKIVQNACFFKIKDASFKNVFGEEMFLLNPPSSRSKEEKKLPEDFESSINKLFECMDMYADCVGSGRIETDPVVHSFVRCSGCCYKGLCRKTFNVGRKD